MFFRSRVLSSAWTCAPLFVNVHMCHLCLFAFVCNCHQMSCMFVISVTKQQWKPKENTFSKEFKFQKISPLAVIGWSFRGLTNGIPGRPGYCPPIELELESDVGSQDVCTETCQKDSDCSGALEKCCPHSCGTICIPALPVPPGRNRFQPVLCTPSEHGFYNSPPLLHSPTKANKVLTYKLIFMQCCD